MEKEVLERSRRHVMVESGGQGYHCKKEGGI